MNMTTRFFSKNELLNLFDKSKLPKDIEEEFIIGVSEVCDFSLIIEEKKISGIQESILKERFEIVSREYNNGRIWIIDLNADCLSRSLLDNDFYEEFCDKKSNPLELSKRISLFYDDKYSYWTDNVYTEAFDK